MKSLYTLIIALLFSATLVSSQEIATDSVSADDVEAWAKNVEVSTGHVEFRDDTHFAYTAQVFNAEVSDVEKEWRKLMKNHAKKVKSSKNEIIAENALFPRLFDDPVDVHATFNELYTTKGVEVNVAFVRDGQALIPADVSSAREEAKREVYDLAIELNRTVVAEELGNEEDNLKDLERDLDKLKKDHENYHGTIEKSETKIASEKASIETLNSEVTQLNSQIAAAKEAASSPPTSKEQKAIDKLSKSLDRTQSKIDKATADIASLEQGIEDAKNAIPANEAEQQKLTESIAKQMENVEKTRYKLRTVQ